MISACGLGFDPGVGRGSHAVGCVVGYIDGRGLGFLLRSCCGSGSVRVGVGAAGIEFVDALRRCGRIPACRRSSERTSRLLLSRAFSALSKFCLASDALARMVVGQACLIFLFGLGRSDRRPDQTRRTAVRTGRMTMRMMLMTTAKTDWPRRKLARPRHPSSELAWLTEKRAPNPGRAKWAEAQARLLAAAEKLASARSGSRKPPE